MMDIKIIKNEQEYQVALSELDKLMDPSPGTPEADKLEVLTLLIDKYEDEHYPIEMPDPVSAIKFRMEQEGLRQKDLIPYIGSQPKVSAILNGKRELSKDMIRKLHKGLGIPYEVLMQIPDAEYEDQKYDVKDFPFNEMVHRGYFPGYADVRQAKRVGERLLDVFFSVFEGNSPTPAYCRHGQKPVDENALLAWQAHVLHQIKDDDISQTKSRDLDNNFFDSLRRFSVYETGVMLVKEHFNKAGIHFVISPHLDKTFLDGASFFTPDGSPVIALTLRYDRLDNFWFTLFHELGHIKLHLAKDSSQAFFDDTNHDEDQDSTPHEKEANQFAWETLIPQEYWEKELLPYFGDLTSEEISAFAEDLDISPAIIAGRIRYESGDYSLFSNLVGHGKVRDQFNSYQVN
ncbi:MAG: ImmA/IrrE family metallo-endopeptidase [Anaerolineaceae bacterium]|nr:ImmA/IrrE family metallo-endopeptidase [Anaerolineaceae bacterium]